MGAEIQIKKLTYHYGQNAELKNVIIQSLIFRLKYLKADVHQFFGVFFKLLLVHRMQSSFINISRLFPSHF